MNRKKSIRKRHAASLGVCAFIAGSGARVIAAPQHKPKVRSNSTVLSVAPESRLVWRVKLAPQDAKATQGENTPASQSKEKVGAPTSQSTAKPARVSLANTGVETQVAHGSRAELPHLYAASSRVSASMRTTTPTPVSRAVANAARSVVQNSASVPTKKAETVRVVRLAAVAPRAAATKPVAAQSSAPVVKKTSGVASRGPADLSARHKDRMLLAQLDAELGQSERRLNRAGADLSKAQKQFAAFSNTLNAAMLDAGPDAKGLHPFVRVAQRYAGTPYVWGGESRNGFDCSGFIIRVMRDLGYKALPHSAAEQFRYGMPVADALLKPGDLVFFANTYKPGISHVGIYLGRRRFIHAAGTGLGTIVSSLDAAKFRAKYAGARRLIAQ